jgi:osmotically-inducible protein OsmY
MTRKPFIFGPAAAFILAAALPALGDDATLRSKVEARLEKAKVTREGDVKVQVDRGTVILDGAVTTLSARREAERQAKKEAKVVENRLRVVPDERTDNEIVKDVRSAILRYPFYSVFDSIEVGVEDGVVLLQGSVYRPNRKQDIESLVAEVRGVREIRNNVSVQSVSIFDDRLRRQLYRQIYGSEDFVQYANRANPPIRIVVDRGRVTLTGYVTSNVERALIDSIARQSLAFDVKNEIKVDGEDTREKKKTPAPAPTTES